MISCEHEIIVSVMTIGYSREGGMASSVSSGRGITTITALRVARFFGTSPAFRLNLLWHERQAGRCKAP